jgi:hypothetical protein
MKIRYDPDFDMALVDYTPGQHDLAYHRGSFGYNDEGDIVTALLRNLSRGVSLRGVPRAEEIARRLRRKGYLVKDAKLLSCCKLWQAKSIFRGSYAMSTLGTNGDARIHRLDPTSATPTWKMPASVALILAVRYL